MAEQKSVDNALTDTVLNRRSFLKLSATIGGSMVLAGGGLKLAQQKATAKPKAVEEKIVHTANNPECNHCAMLVHVRNGRAMRISPDPNFYTRPCLRGYSRIQWTYDPDRVKYPFKRVGERGEGKWERISWDEALTIVAEKLATIRDTYGPEAVWFQTGAILSQIPLQMQGRFKCAFGQGVMSGGLGGLCCNAQAEAAAATQGYRTSGIENYGHSKLHISWGFNPAVSYTPHWRYIADGIERGMRLVTIDPRFSETAAKSDLWLAPKPGTDWIIALGMIKVIIEENLYDAEYALSRTNLPFLVVEETGKLLRETTFNAEGDVNTFYVWDAEANGPVKANEATAPVLEGSFEVEGMAVRTVFSRLKEKVAIYDAAKVTEVSGVDGEQVVLLAREYATVKPALIDSGMSGAQRTTNGENFIASLNYLAVLTGNMGVAGGGVNDTGGVAHWPSNSITSPFKPDVKGRIPATKLGEFLSEGKPYPIKAIYWQGAGLGQRPNANRLVEAFKKMDFVVVQDYAMTDAAQLADIVLPVAQLFERYDLMSPIRNYYFQLMDKAIEPMWESQSDTWIYTELAKRLGFGDLFDKTEEEWIDEMLVNTGLTVKELRERGPVWMWSNAKYNRFGVAWDKPPFYYFKDTPYETASGRFEFHSARWEDKELPPMAADYEHPEECAESDPELFAKYPLSVVSAKTHAFVHSTYHDFKWIREIFPQPWIDINVEDAAARGIQDGDMVEVFNDRGKSTVVARVHTGIRKGVVSMQNGWWISTGGNHSVLTNDNHTKMGGYGHTLNSTLVEVRRA